VWLCAHWHSVGVRHVRLKHLSSGSARGAHHGFEIAELDPLEQSA
jgi:hypothetical protein